MSANLESQKVRVHWLPNFATSDKLRNNVAVVIDALRATSVMAQALASGCAAVYPCVEIEEAQTLAKSLGQAILGGERGGLPIPGFDFGNSPGDYQPQVCQSRNLVMTTTNGTKAIVSCLDASRVFVASFLNLSATVNALPSGNRVEIVCAGTGGEISLEDSVCAGALAVGLLNRGWVLDNDEAELAAGYWRSLQAEALAKSEPFGRVLGRALRRGRGGRNVIRIGLEPDVDFVAQVDLLSVVNELERNPLRIIAS